MTGAWLWRCHPGLRGASRALKYTQDAPARNIAFLQVHTMGDVDETARLWKVNRTIHELVKDRVSGDSDTFSILT